MYRRGWKKEWVDKYLGNPCRIIRGEEDWGVNRVLEAEKTQEVSLLLLTRKTLLPPTKEHKRLAEENMAYIRRHIQVFFERIPENYYEAAVESALQVDPTAKIRNREDTKKHLVINYIRHNCSNYDKVMKKINERKASLSVKRYLFAKVLMLILSRFPHLEKECREQARNKDCRIFEKMLRDRKRDKQL